MTDIFSQYAKDVMGFADIKAAQVGTLILYVRPIMGITIGLLANLAKPIKMLSLGFIFMIVGSLIMASGIIGSSLVLYFFISIIATAIGVYSIRSLYFAIMDDVRIPFILTGTAVGLVSLVGYTPDIFMGPIIGHFLDNYPGELGHQYVFAIVTILGCIRMICCLGIVKLNRKVNNNNSITN